MFRGFKSAGEPSLRYELAKSLHAGDIAIWGLASDQAIRGFFLRSPLRCCDVAFETR